MAKVSGKYAIVGLGETTVGKRPDAATHSLHLEAMRACLEDAGSNVIDCPPDQVKIGMPVEVVFEDHQDYTLPQFRPVK
jgi:acetyl-CoA acetyltransferase